MVDPHVMWTIPQIAERDGVTKQAVSKTVQHLITAHELPVERDGRGRVSRVSLAHYDHLRERFSNPAKKVASPATEGQALSRAVAPEDSFDEARRQEAWLKVDREKLAHQERLGSLIRKDRTVEALTSAGREMQAIISRLPNRADDLALAVSKDGVHGLRIALKDAAFAIAADISACLSRLSLDAPDSDEEIDEQP